MNRSDFQELAELHLQHARALLDAQLYSGAYYMCGYVIECSLKVVEGCSADSRYDKRSRQREAEDLFTAVTHPIHGVLACIKRHW